jgi:hypothetical protein
MNAVFHFVVRRLRWLIGIPGFPHLFDSLLLAWTSLAKPSRLAAMTALEKALDGKVHLAIHRYGGVEFRNGEGKQLGHVHGHGLLDVRMNRDLAKQLIAEGRVHPHHIFPGSGWVSFQLETPDDVPFALSLLAAARPRKMPQESGSKASSPRTQSRTWSTLRFASFRSKVRVSSRRCRVRARRLLVPVLRKSVAT